MEVFHKVYRGMPAYSSVFLESVSVINQQIYVFFNECLKCKDTAVFKVKYPLMKFLKESENNKDIDDDQRDTQGFKGFPVSWYQWKECKNSLGFSNLSKVIHEGNISQLYEEFTNVLPQFIQHSFIKRKQA